MTNYEKLNQYINFTSKEEMNEHLTKFRQQYCYELNETDKDLLLHISRYACRYLGVSYLKVATMSKAIKKSERTVKRSLKKLESLGIIKRYRNFRRVLGGFGASIIQIQQYVTSPVSLREEEEKPCDSKVESRFSKTKPINLSKHKEFINTYKNVLISNEVKKHLKLSFDEMTLYQKIKYLVSATIGSDKVSEVSRVIFGNVNKALKLKNFKENATKVNEIALDSLKLTLGAFKDGRVKNVYGYLNGIINKKLDELAYEFINEIYLDSEPVVAINGTIYNWLDE